MYSIGRSFILLVRKARVFSISVAASSHPLSLEMFFRSFMVSCSNLDTPCTYGRVGLLVFHCAPVPDDVMQRAVFSPPSVLFYRFSAVFRLINRSTLFAGRFPALHALVRRPFLFTVGEPSFETK